VEMLFPAGPGVPGGDPLDRALVVTDAQGAVQQRYVYGLGLISQENADGSGLRVFHYDDAGNTVALTDENGNVTDGFAWDPYGRLTARSGSGATPFQYAARYGVVSDPNGLAYMRARSYSPLYRRFVQRDALQGDVFRPQALNLYAYAGNQPLTFVDPLGLDRDDSCGFWCKAGKFFKSAAGIVTVVGVGLIGLGIAGYGYASGWFAGAGAAGAGGAGGGGGGPPRPPGPGGSGGGSNRPPSRPPAPRPNRPPPGSRQPNMTVTNRRTGEQTFYFDDSTPGPDVYEMETYSQSGGVMSGLETEVASPAESVWQNAMNVLQ
ncbi:MAG TPA: RHS repeat-associated core domain-containing protein, partial [Longimicrobium sp.]|nr:RHS repeat-associated core domain-containing protein [Longimicrobium sp.]